MVVPDRHRRYVPLVEAAEATAKLREAATSLRYGSAKRPASDELRIAWPELGRTWVAAWVTELGRDAKTIASDLRTARNAATEEDALTPLENAAWRLGSAREKLHAVIALSYGVPSIRIGSDARQTLSFRPNVDETRAKLRELRSRSASAQRVIDADGQLKAALLLRHQATHSLAPLIKPNSLTLYEAAIIERGGVKDYVSCHLPPKGLDRLNDIGSTALRERATHLLDNGFRALLTAISELATLLDETAELEPPQIIWQATETSRCFTTRAEASAESREATP
jgi:hypothetical protein